MYTHPTPGQGHQHSQNLTPATTASPATGTGTTTGAATTTGADTGTGTGTGVPQAHHAGYAPQAIPHQPPQHPWPPQPQTSAGGSPTALLGLRSAIILMLGVLVGTGAGVLTYLAERNAAAAILAGGAAFGGAVLFFHTIIAT
ncbi:hypothetical protein JK361_04675 [Streptomyces sp. 5-8]|uniref:Integral membrane protein n=1 Tax=Streptomyces musisoli TaxID=2802280 RepID=A0ABS1NVG2_9ACTN|nr:hypothetical protein [Streptomyces musisoli]MBL1103905.1 hypothetical protein [Streptomyces musisoli]